MSWWLSPSGWPMHADDADGDASFESLGYVMIDESQVQPAIDAYKAGQPAPVPPDFVDTTELDADVAALPDAGPTMTRLRAAFVPFLPPFHGVRYGAFGHSYGNVQSPANAWAGSVFPARLRDLLHVDPALYVNAHQNGAVMAEITSHLEATWTSGDLGLVSLMGFKNDMGNHTAQATFQQNLRDFLNYLLGAANPPTILVIKDVYATADGWALYSGVSPAPTNADVDTYNGYAAAVLAESAFSSAPIVVADPQADGWDTATMLAGDGLHPNDRGMARITASCLKALAGASFRPGLNIAPPAVIPPGTTIAADTFTRTASTPGVTETGGQAWDVRGTGGTPSWTTDGSHLVGSTPSGDSACVVDTGHADGTIQGTLVSLTAGDVGLAFRVTDGANLWVLYAASGGYQLAKRVATTWTFSSGSGPVPANGDVVKVVLSGSSISVYVNGAAVPALSTTDSQWATSTAHGFWTTDVGGTFDSFSATT